MKRDMRRNPATEAMDPFPDQNPNPALRMVEGGTFAYANSASAPILRPWATRVGDPLPNAVADRLRAAAAAGSGVAVPDRNTRWRRPTVLGPNRGILDRRLSRIRGTPSLPDVRRLNVAQRRGDGGRNLIVSNGMCARGDATQRMSTAPQVWGR